MKVSTTLALIALATGSGACHSPTPAQAPTEPRWRYVPDLEVSEPPYATLHVNYKERLDQPYVFLEHRGSYTETGRLLPSLHERMNAAGVVAAGPPFGLYYDDPGEVPLAELRSRACFPVERLPDDSRLEYEVLAPATVVYAVVRGPYPGVARAYPGLLEYAGRMGWVDAGPIREIYLVPPQVVESYDELLCEIQIPVTNRP